MKIIEEIKNKINLIVARNLGRGDLESDKIRLIEINRILDEAEEKYEGRYNENE